MRHSDAGKGRRDAASAGAARHGAHSLPVRAQRRRLRNGAEGGAPAKRGHEHATSRILWLLLLAALLTVPRLAIQLAGLDVHLSLMVDDSSCYLEASRRAVERRGWPTMDGRNATNGFHAADGITHVPGDSARVAHFRWIADVRVVRDPVWSAGTEADVWRVVPGALDSEAGARSPRAPR